MSQDAQIDKICDHKIIKEQLSINADNLSISIPNSLASRVVDLWINGYLVPSNNPKFGWTIEEDPTYIYAKRYKIIFKKIRKSPDDFYFVSYSVPPAYCHKCLGLRVLNDESYTKLGEINMVQNEDKLMQEVKKGVSTELGSNPFNTWIGTQIYQMVGTKAYNVDAIKSRIVYEINNYLGQYLDIQLQQYNYQEVTDRESFAQIVSVDVQPQTSIDPTYWLINIVFTNRAGTSYVYTKTVTTPNASPYS